MDSPLVSIIIPAYNVAPWIGETLKSVLAQTLQTWECLIIDDGSTDDTAARVHLCADSRIKLIQQENAGVSAARNKGIVEAQGQYIVFLDGDDLWTSRTLECLVSALEKDPVAVFSWGNFVRFEDETNRYLPLPGSRIQHTGNLWFDLLVDNFIQIGAFCIRTSLAKRNLFNESISICEDRDWLLRCVKHQKTLYLPMIIHYYRQRVGSAIRNSTVFLQDEARVMATHLVDPDVPANIQRRALSGLRFHAAVLLAKGKVGKITVIKKYIQAILTDPFYLNNYLRPFHKLLWKVLPEQYVTLPAAGVAL